MDIDIDKPRNTADMSTRLGYPSIPIDVAHIPEISENANILDIGSGKKDSHILEQIKQKTGEMQVNITSVDYYPSNLAHLPDTRNRVGADAIALPFPPDAFDVVISSEITQDNPFFFNSPAHSDAMAQEIQRVLKKGGHYIVYHEVSDLIIPLGFRTKHEQRGTVTIGSYIEKGQAYEVKPTGLLFGVYEKFANKIDEHMIGSNTSIENGEYTDDYVRTLTYEYPLDVAFGAKVRSYIVSNRKINSVSILDKMTYGLLGNWETEDQARSTLYHSIRHGKWITVKSKEEDPVSYIEGIKRDGKPIKGVTDDRYLTLSAMYYSGYFHVIPFENFIVTIPNQRLLDLLMTKAEEVAAQPENWKS